MTNIITKATLCEAQNMLAFFILVDVECLGTESGSKQETQPDLHIIKDLELLLLSAANGEWFQIPEALSSYMEGDVDQACLKTQLLMIPDMIKTAFDGSIKKVTIMRTLTGAMNKSEIYKDMLSEVDKLLLYISCDKCDSQENFFISSVAKSKHFHEALWFTVN